MDEKKCQENYNQIIQSRNWASQRLSKLANFLILIANFTATNLKEIYTSKC